MNSLYVCYVMLTVLVTLFQPMDISYTLWSVTNEPMIVWHVF